MAPLPSHPKLRWPLDLRMDEHEGRKIIIVNCPLGVSKEPLVLVGEVAPIISSFDGTMSLDDLYKRFSPYGVKQALIDELVTLLDQALFLATPSFFAAEKSMKELYFQSPVRPAALAGLSYAASKELLKTELDQYLSHGSSIATTGAEKLILLKSPHIDYRRGGVCYGKTYSYLKGAPHELYIVIGTSHMYSRYLFHLTKKHFENPIGTLEADVSFVATLAKRYGEKRSFEDEFLHKREHSLELQVPFLSFLTKQPKIVPILVGGFHQMVSSGKAPQQFEAYETFAQALSETMGEWIEGGRSICIVAGVDMAHVGRQFGDKDPLTMPFMEQVGQRDEQYLQAIEGRNKEELWAHIAEDNDARRICGFPTMYTVLDVMDRLRLQTHAERYDYRQAVDYQTDCGVTFAGMGMYTR